jgi:hypothetical protein
MYVCVPFFFFGVCLFKMSSFFSFFPRPAPFFFLLCVCLFLMYAVFFFLCLYLSVSIVSFLFALCGACTQVSHLSANATVWCMYSSVAFVR